MLFSDLVELDVPFVLQSNTPRPQGSFVLRERRVLFVFGRKDSSETKWYYPVPKDLHERLKRVNPGIILLRMQEAGCGKPRFDLTNCHDSMVREWLDPIIAGIKC